MPVRLLFVVLMLISMAQAQEKPAPGKGPHAYDSSHDRIWTSMEPGETYTRDSPSKPGTLEFLQRHNDTQIAVPAPCAGTVISIGNKKGYTGIYTALVFSGEKGKLYHYRFSRVVVKKGQKLAKGETLGFRPGVVRVSVTLIGPDGKPSEGLRSLLPFMRELPSEADKPN